MSQKDSRGVVFTKENNYYIVGTNQNKNNNAECSLSSIVLPSFFQGIPVKIIGHYAFRNSSTLKSIFIPNSIEIIRNDGLSYTSKLENVHFADNSKLRELGVGVFYSSNLKNIVLPSSLKIFGYNCFGRSSFESIFICGIPKTINEHIFGTDGGNFLKFPEHLYVNKRFPFESFGDFSNITQTDACNLNIKTCRMNRRTQTFSVYFALLIIR